MKPLNQGGFSEACVRSSPNQVHTKPACEARIEHPKKFRVNI